MTLLLAQQLDEMKAASSRQLEETSLLELMPPRQQWNTNHGYCGETSFIQAGLLFGQYIGQYQLRQLLSRHQSRASDQLLVGVNDAKAARELKLRYEILDPRATISDWLIWTQAHVKAGHPVIVGVFMNFGKDFFGPSGGAPGDSEYDHIVTVVDVAGELLANHAITLHDHGLRDDVAGVFSANVFDIYKNRKAADMAIRAYSIPGEEVSKYGIALMGPADVAPAEYFPVHLATNVTGESPSIKEGSNSPPTASAISLSVSVRGLAEGKSYVVYMYDSFASVPKSTSDPAETASKSWILEGVGSTQESFSVQIMSDEIAVFRCYEKREKTTTASATATKTTTTTATTRMITEKSGQAVPRDSSASRTMSAMVAGLCIFGAGRHL